MAMEVEEPDEKKKATVSHADFNMQDVIVASAGDDGSVWIWKPLQVGYFLSLGVSDYQKSVLLVKCSFNMSFLLCFQLKFDFCEIEL